ncbi:MULTISPECIES: YcfL family protein [unclassified Nitratiruptor]|uniref:YcfL family protein n=1 Tax=unclassified Nitratiruptor TaxID=2624044 RepID=UPI00191629BD|nr:MULTISPECIES: YcfL family protein [unclassified Nitratiruptor]BCD60977.1 hypothetical protein NitYY0810_C1757 [Nitratiruptor sp. YY08-10]BCD64909.1 hypothetical protein NitYY0814_C1765 [Nitratiruptor sp. YY08-14]
MKRWLIALSVLFLLTGCAKSVSNEAVSNPDRNIIKNSYLEQKVEILDHHTRYTNGLLEAMVRLHNKTKDFQDLEYRFIWLDSDGFVVEKEPWQPLTLNGLETTQVSSIAHSPNVVDFKFEIRQKQ